LRHSVVVYNYISEAPGDKASCIPTPLKQVTATGVCENIDSNEKKRQGYSACEVISCYTVCYACCDV